MRERQPIHQYRHDVRRYVQRSIRGSHELDDIVQEVFLRFHARGRVEALDRPAGYLMSIARNLLIDRSRRSSPLGNAVSIDEVGDHALAIAPEQEQARRVADLRLAYEAALAELSPRCREVFVQRRHEEIDTGEAAARFGISTRMVQKYMARATAHLEKRLSGFTDRAATGATCGR